MKRYLFTAVILCLLAMGTSCTNETSVLNKRGFFLELSFSDGASSTRTYGPTTEDLEEERTISDLSVYLVNKHEPYTIYKVNGITFNPENNRSALIEIPIERQGIYNLYVVTNTVGNSSFSANAVYENDFIGQYGPYDYQMAKKFWTPNHFMMVNVQNEVDGYAGVEVNLTGEHPMDDPLSVHVNLDRLALKVVVKEDAAMTATPVGMVIYGTKQNHRLVSMKVDGVCLMNCAKNINLIQKWTKATNWTDSGSPKGYPELLLSSPSSDIDYSISAGYYNRWSDFVKPTYEIFDDIEFTAPGSPMYCFENNSPYYEDLLTTIPSGEAPLADYAVAKTKMKGRTTAVVVRVRCSLVDSGYLTEDLTIDPQEGNWTRTDNGTYSTFYMYNGVCYGDLELLQAKNPDLAGISTVSALRAAGVKVYEDGLMYFVHWIKDINYTDDADHYYSVMRNTYYGLNVTSIENLGDDIPGGEDYNQYDPIDVGDNPLKATATICDWTIFEIHHTL